jgi:uncharacterized phage infection (PIP) family protein YhgE
MLLVKWAVMIAAAPLSAALVQLVAGWGLDMPIPAPLELYLFSTTTVAAVGMGALSVFAVFGAVGPIINMFFFVAMSMTSSAGTGPLEATPPFFRAIATFDRAHRHLPVRPKPSFFQASQPCRPRSVTTGCASLVWTNSNVR